jgi:hypothetical protein
MELLNILITLKRLQNGESELLYINIKVKPHRPLLYGQLGATVGILRQLLQKPQ